jgi:hypothetical protein
MCGLCTSFISMVEDDWDMAERLPNSDEGVAIVAVGYQGSEHPEVTGG